MDCGRGVAMLWDGMECCGEMGDSDEDEEAERLFRGCYHAQQLRL